MAEPITTRDLTPIARAIHDGLGESWAYSNYGGDEWNSMRTELMSAAASAWLVVAPEIEHLRAALREADAAMRGAGWGSSQRARLRIAEALKYGE